MYIGTTELTLTVRFGFSFLLHIAMFICWFQKMTGYQHNGYFCGIQDRRDHQEAAGHFCSHS